MANWLTSAIDAGATGAIPHFENGLGSIDVVASSGIDMIGDVALMTITC